LSMCERLGLDVEMKVLDPGAVVEVGVLRGDRP